MLNNIQAMASESSDSGREKMVSKQWQSEGPKHMQNGAGSQDAVIGVYRGVCS